MAIKPTEVSAMVSLPTWLEQAIDTQLSQPWTAKDRKVGRRIFVCDIYSADADTEHVDADTVEAVYLAAGWRVQQCHEYAGVVLLFEMP